MIKRNKLFSLINEILRNKDCTFKEFISAYYGAIIFYYHDTYGLSFKTIKEELLRSYDEKEKKKQKRSLEKERRQKSMEKN